MLDVDADVGLTLCAVRLPSADLLSGLLGVAEGRRDLGFDIGGSPLLTDDVDQQVDEHLVILQ